MTEPPSMDDLFNQFLAGGKKTASPKKTAAPAKKKPAARKRAAPRKASTTPASRNDELERRLDEWRQQMNAVWAESNFLTPRQAAIFVTLLHEWADTQDWHLETPLHERPLFSALDLRVTMLVHDNLPWISKAYERCRAVAKEMETGVLPFQRRGCYFDEVLMGVCLQEAPDWMDDVLGLLNAFPQRPHVEPSNDDEPVPLADDDWGRVGDTFDDEAWWGDWEVPIFQNHPLLAHILATRPPTTWFDLLTEPATPPEEVR